MSIKFHPTEMIKKLAPESKIKKLVSKGVTLKRAALSFIDEDVIDKKSVAKVALKTIRGYQERIAKAQVDAGFDKAAGDEVAADIIKDPKQLIQRVQNEMIFQVHEQIKENYAGKTARWLPSDSSEPRPEHQLNYGKEYIIGEGINGVEPGDEWGCKCGVEILVEQTKLELG